MSQTRFGDVPEDDTKTTSPPEGKPFQEAPSLCMNVDYLIKVLEEGLFKTFWFDDTYRFRLIPITLPNGTRLVQFVPERISTTGQTKPKVAKKTKAGDKVPDDNVENRKKELATTTVGSVQRM